MQLVTHQTGPQGQKVRRLLIEEGADITQGALRRHGGRPRHAAVVLMASSEGGMDIEEVAAQDAGEDPQGVHRSGAGPDRRRRRRRRAQDRHSRARAWRRRARCFKALYQALRRDRRVARRDQSADRHRRRPVVALDAKLNFDDNALFRHPDIVAMRDLDEEDPAEIEASKFDLSYISLDGNIGCLVNGAGLAMATMDIDQALRRRARQLPRRRRRRDRGEGHRGVQDHADATRRSRRSWSTSSAAS